MADLTESEKKMILERTQNIGLRKEKDLLRVVLALSELLLAMKERAARIADEAPGALIDIGEETMTVAAALRNSDFGDLFKEKV